MERVTSEDEEFTSDCPRLYLWMWFDASPFRYMSCVVVGSHILS